jgi:lipid-binding SYLF domain-containing protein
MKKWVMLLLVCLAVALPSFAQSKVDERLSDSIAVLTTILSKPDSIPKSLLDKAACVLLYPGVKKVGVGLGVTYGRGVLVCRSGKNMNGNWGAPAMYTLDTGSLGPQLGSTSTDYLLLVMTLRGADKVLSDKLKLGADATAVAGPSGVQASRYDDPNVDILTYSQAKGLFAGASLGSASIAADNEANAQLYGKDVDVIQIVRGEVPTPAGAHPLIAALEKASPQPQVNFGRPAAPPPQQRPYPSPPNRPQQQRPYPSPPPRPPQEPDPPLT